MCFPVCRGGYEKGGFAMNNSTVIDIAIGITERPRLGVLGASYSWMAPHRALIPAPRIDCPRH